jgi:hypothetical protein
MVTINPSTYYNCTSTSCIGAIVSATNIVRNPITGFAVDNNGSALTMPPVATGGALTVAGTLTFGVGTQTNNVLGVMTKFPINSTGEFTTTYKGVTTASYIDSGSNSMFFKDATIPLCLVNTWMYCPASSLSVSATNGTQPGVTTVSIDNGDTVFSGGNAAGVIGGSTTLAVFDWGMPFFYGRTVMTAISGKSTPYGAGPFWAY